MAKSEFTIVKETSVDTLIALGTKGDKAQWTADKAGDGNWSQTVALIHEHVGFGSFDASKEDKELKEDIRKAFKSAFLAKASQSEEGVPVRGWDARKKCEFDVLNDDGEIKWSSWAGTRAPISYCGEFCAFIKQGKLDKLYEELETGDLKVYHKSKAKKGLAKQSAVETCKAALDMVQKKFPELSLSDMELILDMTHQMHGALSTVRDEKAKTVAQAA